ncbi:MAG: alpha-galactosidase [Olsenella sp.]|jgi:alpha-galactosidase|nr:alpha-galactosidase [Olsenella sp.]MCI1288918.1 alpha-galactosidase [Olsenella sp.]
MDQDPRFQIAWRVPGGGQRTTYVSRQVPTFGPDCRDLDVSVERDGDVWHVWVDPEYDLTVENASATVSVDLEHADALYLNGYDSKTNSWECSPRVGMRGLWGIPGFVADHWALDAEGDYRIARQDPRPGRQHGSGYGYVRNGRAVTLFGECRPDTGLTSVYEDLSTGSVTLTKEGPARRLAAGERVELLTLLVTTGTLQEAFGRLASLMGVERRPALPLVGFTSWFRHGDDIDEPTLERDLVGVADVLLAQPLEDVLPVFAVDSGYARMGDWLAPDERRFPRGMGSLATSVRAAGLVPGLWLAPFVCERGSRTYAEHPGWLLRDADGRPVKAGSQGGGVYALDTRNDEVREYVRSVLGVATHDWGYGLLKLDWLFAAAMLPHDGMNRGQLMADALDLLRSAVPEGTPLDFCGVPVVSAMGRCEYCRISCDVSPDWDGKPLERMLGRERVSTWNSLRDTEGRSHLNGVAFLNDPGVYYLRRDVAITNSQRTRLLSADALLGGALVTSDDMGAWDQRQCSIFRNALETFVQRNRERGLTEVTVPGSEEEPAPLALLAPEAADEAEGDQGEPEAAEDAPVAEVEHEPENVMQLAKSEETQVWDDSNVTSVVPVPGPDVTVVDRPLMAAIEAAGIEVPKEAAEDEAEGPGEKDAPEAEGDAKSEEEPAEDAAAQGDADEAPDKDGADDEDEKSDRPEGVDEPTVLAPPLAAEVADAAQGETEVYVMTPEDLAPDDLRSACAETVDEEPTEI